MLPVSKEMHVFLVELYQDDDIVRTFVAYDKVSAVITGMQQLGKYIELVYSSVRADKDGRHETWLAVPGVSDSVRIRQVPCV